MTTPNTPYGVLSVYHPHNYDTPLTTPTCYICSTVIIDLDPQTFIRWHAQGVHAGCMDCARQHPADVLWLELTQAVH